MSKYLTFVLRVNWCQTAPDGLACPLCRWLLGALCDSISGSASNAAPEGGASRPELPGWLQRQLHLQSTYFTKALFLTVQIMCTFCLGTVRWCLIRGQSFLVLAVRRVGGGEGRRLAANAGRQADLPQLTWEKRVLELTAGEGLRQVRACRCGEVGLRITFTSVRIKLLKSEQRGVCSKSSAVRQNEMRQNK